MVIYRKKSLIKFKGKNIVPYYFEDGYENHQYGDVNAIEAMERMEEILDHFKEHTCVEFKRLKTEKEKNQYYYKIMIVHDEKNEGTCGGWSYLGKPKNKNFFLVYFIFRKIAYQLSTSATEHVSWNLGVASQHDNAARSNARAWLPSRAESTRPRRLR